MAMYTSKSREIWRNHVKRSEVNRKWSCWQISVEILELRHFAFCSMLLLLPLLLLRCSTININNTNSWESADKYKRAQNRYVLWKLGIIYGLYLHSEQCYSAPLARRRYSEFGLVWFGSVGFSTQDRRRVDNDDLDLVEQSMIEEWPHHT